MGNSESSEKAQAQRTEEEHQPSALVIVGPSGVGKGTLINKLMAGNDRYGFSCSHTTRAPRQGEKACEPFAQHNTQGHCAQVGAKTPPVCPSCSVPMLPHVPMVSLQSAVSGLADQLIPELLTADLAHLRLTLASFANLSNCQRHG